MPSDRVNHILQAIDAGLQSPDPTVVAITTAPRASTCWRCSKHKTTRDSGLCEGCRAWMAGECDDDPAERVHERVEVANKMGDVPETRPTVAGPGRTGPGRYLRMFVGVTPASEGT